MDKGQGHSDCDKAALVGHVLFYKQTLVEPGSLGCQYSTHSASYLHIPCPESLFQLLDYLPVLQCYVKCPYTGVRHMGARVVGMLSTLYTQSVMAFVIEEILPMCESTEDETQRQGASEVISSILFALLTHSNLTLAQISPEFYLSAVSSLLKTLWQKEKLLITSNFSFCHSVFY